MSIDAAQLQRHYASISDDELIALDRDSLTEIAQQCYDEEIKRRGIVFPSHDSTDEETAAIPDDDSPAIAATEEELAEFEELDNPDVSMACSFAEHGGGSATVDAEEAYQALRAAGVPCRVRVVRVEPEPVNPRPYTDHQLLVPSSQTLHATSILDKAFFNPRMEEDWKNHLEGLTNEELLQFSADDLCAGLLDRAARLRKIYSEEINRRKLEGSQLKYHTASAKDADNI
jgi:hypothetical protein